MSALSRAILARRERGEGALVCYLTAGYPDPPSFLEYYRACVEGGADVMEVGIPFSDPVADGPTIQATSHRALEQGVTPSKALGLVRQVGGPAPIVLMGYYNPVFRMGEERFAASAAEAGASGMIVADLPCEESPSLRSACLGRGLDLIQLVAPTTDEARMRAIAQASSGYLYLVGALGTTGARAELEAGLGALISRAKRAAGPLPVAVGFGISSAQHVRQVVGAGADAAIVGSAILAMIGGGAAPDRVRSFVEELRGGCRADLGREGQ